MRVYRDIVENGILVSKEIFNLKECTYSGKDMGERSIVATINWASPIDFQIGDYIKLPMQNLIRSTNGVNGSIASGSDEAEKFYIYTMPTIKKVARAMSNGKAFEHTVTFYPAQYELGCVQMRDLGNGLNADSVIYTGFDSVTFNGGAHELMERIMMVLKEAYHDSEGNPLWSYEISDAVNEDVNLALERFPISFSGNTVMDALLELNNKETINTTFFINNRKIYVGFKRPYFCRVTDGMSIDTNPSSQLFTFQYGKTSDKGVALQYGGLYDITKTVGKEVPITKLFAYGASRNLNRYYCSDRVKGGRYVNRLMLPSFDADGKTDFIISEDALQRYGVREATKQFEEIYPSIRYATYGDIRQVKYCIKVKASGLNDDDNSYPVARVQCYKIEANGTSGVNKLVEAAPPDDLAVFIHAMDKTVKVILCGGATNEEAINKQRTRDANKVPTTSSGTYIPGSCFIVHDRGFDEEGTSYENASRDTWFASINNLDGFTDKQKEEIKLNQINYTDTFWLTDLYIFQEYNQTYFSRDGYSAWSWARLNNQYATSGGHVASDSVQINEIVHVEPITISDINMTVDGIDKPQATFDIYLRDLGFTINEQNDFGDMVFLQNGTVKVSILDGLLAGQEFEISGSINSTSPSCICAYNDDGSQNQAFFDEPDYTQDGANPQTPYDAFNKGAIWRIRLNRTNVDEADYSNLNLAMPTKEINAKAGDHLVLLDIFMPDIYIHAAENRLLREARKYLEANDNGSISYAVNFDKVRMQQIPNYAMQMREGLNLRVIDDDLNIKTENNGRYLANYGERPLISYIPVKYDNKQFAFTKNYKKASASIENNSMDITVVLNHDENWLRSPYIQLSQAGKTFDITSNITRQVQSLGWSEEAQGYVYKVITKTLPSGFSQNDNFDIYRNTISNISSVNSKWCSIKEGIDFTRGRYYTLVVRVKDYGYFNDSLVNNFALFKTKDDSEIKYSPEYEMTIEHIEGSAELNVTIKFQLDNSFDDSSVYYPSLLIPYDNVVGEVKLSFYSIFERDFDENTTVLNYADFTIDSLTIKITDSNTDSEPIREITATLSEQQNATAWSTLMNKVSTVVKEGEQNKKVLEEVANNARKYTQALAALKNSIFDPDGNCDQAFLQVMMQQIGADSMNYQLDNTRLSPDGTFYNCNLENNVFVVYNADTLRHFVFTEGSQAGNWEVTGNVSASLDGTSNYFICIKCKKNDNIGEWVVSTKQYAVNDPEDDSCYYFNWGILTVDSGGVYTLMETRGNAYMYGDNLVCGKIKTLAGNSYFDLTHGNFVLGDGTGPALEYINGVLTIRGSKGDAEDTLEQLGILQGDVEDAVRAAEQAAYTNIYNGGDISVSTDGIKEITLKDAFIQLATLGCYVKFTKERESYLPPFSKSCIIAVKKGTDVSQIYIHKDDIYAYLNWGDEYTPTEECDFYVALAEKEYIRDYLIPGVFDFIEYEMRDVWTISGINVIVRTSDAIQSAMQAIANEEDARTEALAEAVSNINGGIDELQKQIDGEVSSYFYDTAPIDEDETILTDIPPFNEWAENYNLRNGVYVLKTGARNEFVNHIGDTYTNMEEYKEDSNGNTTTPLAGLSWRWCDATTVSPLPKKYITIRYTSNGSITTKKLHWHKIADSDAVKALQEAGRAQSTADHKSTIFTALPSNYSVGDMWILMEDTRVGGTLYKKGTILNSSDNSETFNYRHWSEDVKYIDEDIARQQAQQALDGLIVGGTNLIPAVGFSSSDSNQTITKLQEELYSQGVYQITKKTSSTPPASAYNITQYVTAGKTYVASVYIRCDTAPSGTSLTKWGLIRFYGKNASGASVIYADSLIDAEPKVGQWYQRQVVYTIPSDFDASKETINIFCYAPSAAGVKSSMSCIKLEEGNKATPTYNMPISSIAQWAEESLQQLSDMSNDGILTPQEKKNVSNEWSEIQGMYSVNSNNVTSLFGSSKPTEWTEYDDKYSKLSAYITRLNLENGSNTTITKTDFQDKFSDYYNADVNLQKAIAKKSAELEVAAMEIGGRNLLRNSATFTHVAGSTNNFAYKTLTPTVGLQPNTNYVFSVDKGEMTAGSDTAFTVYLFSGDIKTGRNKLTIPISSSRQSVNFKTTAAVTDTDVVLIYAGQQGTTAGKAIKLTNIKLEQGTKATDWTPAPEDVDDAIAAVESKAEALGYLTEVLEDSKNTTDITGGLVMTNVLMLKDLANAGGSVGAGMSGISADNILMWGGGAYEDAVHAKDNDFEKLNGSDITTLLKKDGTGKIGIFKISETQAVVDVPNQGKVIIDASTANGGIFIHDKDDVQRIIISPQTISDSGYMPKNVDVLSGTKNGSSSVEGSTSTHTATTTLTLYSKSIDYDGTFSLSTLNISISGINTIVSGMTSMNYTSATIVAVDVKVKNGTNTTSIGSFSTSKGVTSGSTNISSKEISVQKGTVEIQLVVSSRIVGTSLERPTSCSFSYSSNLSSELVPLYNSKTIMCKDGIISAYDSRKYFMVQNTEDGQKIFAKGLQATKPNSTGNGELYVSDYLNDGLVKALYDGFSAISEVLEKCRYEGSNANAQENAKNACTNIRTQLAAISIIANS